MPFVSFSLHPVSQTSYHMHHSLQHNTVTNAQLDDNTHKNILGMKSTVFRLSGFALLLPEHT